MLATAARFAFAARRTPYFVDIAALPRRCKHDSNDRLPDDADRTIGARKADREERASNLLSPENLDGLSPLEVARMRVAYGLVKEHADALRTEKTAIDPETNPLIDPRSFDIRTLPKLSPELLKHFRAELPPEEASTVKPVWTQGAWDIAEDGSAVATQNEELINKTDAEWAVVDERTMDPKQYSRMRRQSLTTPGSAATQRAPYAQSPGQHKRKCALSDARGRVHVDFRAVGSLRPYLSEGGKIIPTRKSGLSAKAQRKVARAVKTARQMALLHPEPNPKLSIEEMIEIDRNLP